ncbi:MAG TPA: NUDIX domain-containing protein [Patescibacteria group bacterium]|nr:NUDIX domain-containing protein [Patescibacteria group bacterium]
MKNGKDFIGVGVGVMIFNDKGELLLTKRGQGAKNERGCWEVPGGGVEFGETLAQAAVREAKEEMGIDVTVVQQLFSIDHLIPAEGQHWVATPFLVKIKKGQVPQILEPEKCDGLGWFATDNLPSPLSITTKLNLKVYRQYLALKS